MSKPNLKKIIALRLGLMEDLSSSSEFEKGDIIATFANKKCNENWEKDCRRALANIYITKLGLEISFKTGVRALEESCRIFDHLARKNRLIRVWARDVYMIFGGYLYKHGEFKRAVIQFEIFIVVYYQDVWCC